MLTELSVRAGLTYRPADRPAVRPANGRPTAGQRPADRSAWTGVAGREAGGMGGSGGSAPRQRTLMISIMISRQPGGRRKEGGSGVAGAPSDSLSLFMSLS